MIKWRHYRGWELCHVPIYDRDYKDDPIRYCNLQFFMPKSAYAVFISVRLGVG